jgi:hypothetical protein
MLTKPKLKTTENLKGIKRDKINIKKIVTNKDASHFFHAGAK